MSAVLCNGPKSFQRRVSSVQCVCECLQTAGSLTPEEQLGFVFFESADCFKSHLYDTLHPFKGLEISDLTRLYISAFFIYTSNG